MTADTLAPWLTPQRLQELGALQPMSPPGRFDPEGDWVNRYRMWAAIARGRIDYGQSRMLGHLVLRRTRRPDGDGFTLSLHQKVVMDEGDPAGRRPHGWHEIDAEIRCRCDELARPVSWRMRNRFGRDLAILDHLTMQEQGAKTADGAAYTIGDETFPIHIDTPWTSDWSLFEAVQRLDGTADEPLRFELLEKLRLPKPGQVIRRNPALDCELAGIGPLRCFSQTGHGILPVDYWRDAAGRLRIVVTLHVAWILDEQAEEKTEQMLRDGVLRKFEGGQ